MTREKALILALKIVDVCKTYGGEDRCRQCPFNVNGCFVTDGNNIPTDWRASELIKSIEIQGGKRGTVMKLVVEIDEVTYKDIKKGKIYSSIRDVPLESVNAIANGVPLPKGHGNLIQREEAEAIFRNAKMALYKQSHTEQIKDLQTRELMLLNAEQFVHLIKPIIEADKTEIEPQESDGQA